MKLKLPSLKMSSGAKIGILSLVIAGGAAAAWFLYLEEMVFGSGAPTATAPKPAAVAAAPAKPEPAKPAAEPAKPAAAAAAPAAPAKPEPAKPAAEPAKPAATAAAAPAAAKPAAEPAKPAPVAMKEPEKPAAAAPKEPAKRAAGKPKPSAEEVAAALSPPAAPAAPAEPAADAQPAAEPAAPAAPAAPRKVAAREPAPPQFSNVIAFEPRFNDLVTAVLYRDVKAVDELIAFGKWADKADSAGMTPLMIAVTLGDGPIAESLLKAGANPNRPGPGGATAVSLARERNDAPMLGLLQRYSRAGP